MAVTFQNVAFYKVDYDQNRATAEASGIRIFPTFQFFRHGIRLDEILGPDIHAVKSKIHELNYMIDEPIDLKLGGYSAKNKNYNTP